MAMQAPFWALVWRGGGVWDLSRYASGLPGVSGVRAFTVWGCVFS